MTWADTYEFHGDFYRVADEKRLVAELAKELGVGHPLHGKAWRIVARYRPQDEVVVTTDAEVYQVHLTWKGSVEQSGYPHWDRFATAAEFEAANNFR